MNNETKQLAVFLIVVVMVVLGITAAVTYVETNKANKAALCVTEMKTASDVNECMDKFTKL